MKHVPQLWSRSKPFRTILTIVLIYAALRLAVHFVYMAYTLPDDLRIYLQAADNLLRRQALYPTGAVTSADTYQYAPSFALAFTIFLGLPRGAAAVIHTLLHVGAYGWLYVEWDRIFRRLGLDRANEMLAWLLPVWLIFAQFWSDLGYLNVYIFMALLSTLFIDALLDERLGWSLVWVSIILQIKPMWAFALVLPLLLGRYRFFLKLLALTVAAYAVIAGVTMLAIGPAYGWQQHLAYVRHLSTMESGNFAWRTPDMGVPGYNHSIAQIVIYYLTGVTPAAFRLALLIKAFILAPLAVVGARCLLRPARRVGREIPQLSLDLAFALYLGAFIWLDVVWEVSLGIAVFTYLLATLDPRQRWSRVVMWAAFAPYVLRDFLELASFIMLGNKAIWPGGLFFVMDPTIYFPLIMIIIVIFYGLLVRRLLFAPQREPEPCEG